MSTLKVSDKKKSYRLFLVVLSALLVVTSIVVHMLEEYLIYRFLRGLVSISFLAIIVWFKGKKTNLLLALFLLCYGTSSFVTLGYENKVLATIALFLNFFSLLFLIKALWPKASFKNLGTTLTVVFLVLIVVNSYLFYEFVTMLKDFAFDSLHYAAMLLGAMALVICCFLALVYNHATNTKASLVFTIVIFLIVFAEIFRAIAYYDIGFGNLSVYLARCILIVATALLAHFAIMAKTEREALSSKIL